MSEKAQKPLILPHEIVELLRGERRYTQECEDFVLLARICYQDGKAGQPYDMPEAPKFDPWTVELAESFLLACWEQGRKDAGRKSA